LLRRSIHFELLFGAGRMFLSHVPQFARVFGASPTDAEARAQHHSDLESRSGGLGARRLVAAMSPHFFSRRRRQKPARNGSNLEKKSRAIPADDLSF
jgi:hypothetical protein